MFYISFLLNNILIIFRMPNSCCAANCRVGYKTTSASTVSSCRNCSSTQCDCKKFQCVCKSLKCQCQCRTCKPILFSFPTNPFEREQWIRACPNVLKPGANRFICEWHWPENYETCSPTGKGAISTRRPKHPPSIFDGVPPSCARSISQARSRSERLSRSDIEIDELEIFLEEDAVHSLEEIEKKLSAESEKVTFVRCTEYLCIFSGPVQRMDFSITIKEDLFFELHCRGVKVDGNLGIKKFKSLSQIHELYRFLRLKHFELDDTLTRFNDSQNTLLVAHPKQRRYSTDDIKLALKLASLSRASYLALQSYAVLPSIRTLQNIFASSKNINFNEIISALSPMQKYVYLNIDEVYVRPGLRFSGGEIYGQAEDDSSKLAKTILVILANCDYGGPKFVAAMKPVNRLNASFQRDVVLDVIRKLEEAGSTVFCCTFDGNSLNTRMVQMMPDLSSPTTSTFNGHPIFWLNDPVHLLKCVRNNFLNAKKLQFVPPGDISPLVAKWDDLKELFQNESSVSQCLSASKLTKVAVDPPLISRQRVDLALKVFCKETASALRCVGKDETAKFIELIVDYFYIMNTKSPSTGIHLRDPLRHPIDSTNHPCFSFLTDFKEMVSKMKPIRARRAVGEMTLTTETSVSLSRSIEGFLQMVNFLLANGYQYVLLGRYTSDHIEKLFGKWRQSAGSNYYISVADVMQAERIQWAKITTMVLGRTTAAQSTHFCDLCSADPSEIFDIDMNIDSTSDQLRGVCAYVAGYLCHKFSSLPCIQKENIDPEEGGSFEFIHHLNRGGLKIPGETVVTFVILCHHVFDHLQTNGKHCRNYIIQCFEVVDDMFDTNINNTDVFRTLANILMNNYSHSVAVEQSDKSKAMKLSNK